MKYFHVLSLLTTGLVFGTQISQASETEIPLSENLNTKTFLSIYNNDLGFVRDTRNINLPKGKSTIAFEGVANRIKPETAMLMGSGIKVIEQNYNYNLINPYNILNNAIGEKVKAITTNPQTGQETVKEATIISANGNMPVLQFDYGIETNFPGRIVYSKLPQGLRTKPTLAINIETAQEGDQQLELDYLTNGLSWKADYVAEITDKENLNLNGWVTLNNVSGTDYKNAHIQLIAGEVKQTSPSVMRNRALPLMAAKGAMAADSMAESVSIPRSTVGDYYVYEVPVQTTIKDKQSKQVNMMTHNNVLYKKEYRLISPLFIGVYTSSDEFEKQNPDVLFKITNDQTSNLGVPLPAGTIRLYEKGENQLSQFIGEGTISHSSIGSKLEINTGKAFDISTKGKITEIRTISKNIKEISVSFCVENYKKEVAHVSIEQNFGNDYEILNESIKGEEKTAHSRLWKLSLTPNEKQTLTFKVRVSNQQ